MISKSISTSFSDLVMKATGPLPYSLTNDYMFRALLQENNKVLKGLIGSLLHLEPNEIISAEITNPIILGETVQNKEFVLDIQVILNNNTLINLEMQVVNYKDWPERSLGYLCRTFDNLNKGENYINTKLAIHIGFLDFTLFPEKPEFYSSYKLTNVKNNTIYSDKFVLSVVDLNNIELATEEDKKYKIDYWAKLFKAKTWEDIKMYVDDYEYISEAADTLMRLNADERVRQLCDARTEYYARERYNAHVQKEFANVQKEYANAQKKLEGAQKELEGTQKELEKTQKELVDKDAELERLRKEIKELKAK